VKQLVVVLVFAAGVAAQTPQRPAFGAFEVASIKPDPNPAGRFIRMQTATQFTVHNHTVRTLLAAAFNLSPNEVLGGPALVDSDHWAIVAKTSAPRPTLEQQMAMLRQLLADRFHVRFHREPKEMGIYALTAAKGSPKLKPSTLDPDAEPAGPPPLIFVVSLPVLKLAARYASMDDLANLLQRALERPVADRTGLTGRYDFDLEFTPDETLFDGAFKGAEDESKPGLLAALQDQLGLKLNATKGPVSALVIDHAERPTEN
jgi:uncharacterized protein (TIGR03435 family)